MDKENTLNWLDEQDKIIQADIKLSRFKSISLILDNAGKLDDDLALINLATAQEMISIRIREIQAKILGLS